MWHCEVMMPQAHTQHVREHSVTVVSARWAPVEWSWPKEWNWCVRANLQFKKKIKNRNTGGVWMVKHSPQILASGGKATIIMTNVADWALRKNYLSVRSMYKIYHCPHLRSKFSNIAFVLQVFCSLYLDSTIHLLCCFGQMKDFRWYLDTSPSCLLYLVDLSQVL